MGLAVTHLEVCRMNLLEQDTNPLCDYRTIPLTKGKFALVDADDFDRVTSVNWCASSSGRTLYAMRKHKIDGKSHTMYMHRYVLGVTKRTIQVDHINGDTLNNTKANLRIATNAQNGANRKRLNVNNTSGFMGVAWYKALGKWHASIMIARKSLHVGYFETLELAALARDNAAVSLLGEFAKLNFPELRK